MDRLPKELVIAVFILLQVADGYLTYVGVNLYGMKVEGNPVIAWLMRIMGVPQGLFFAKSAASCFAYILVFSYNAIHVIVGLSILYSCAVFVWLYILLFY